jgi:hypothetical protein
MQAAGPEVYTVSRFELLRRGGDRAIVRNKVRTR